MSVSETIAETLDPPSSTTEEDLIRQHQRGVWRFLRLLGCEPNLADDLTQEALLRLLRSPPQDHRPQVVGRWLRTTALNLFRDTRRQPRTGVVLDAESLEQLWTQQVQEDGGGDSYVDALRHCMKALPDQKRQAVILRYQEGRSRRAVAAALEVTEEACKSILRRARAWLHNCIHRTIRRDS